MTSITVIGFQISYAIPVLLRAWQGSAFVRSDFHLGAAGPAMAWVAGAWLVVTSCFLCWPSAFPVSKLNMNYTVVVVGGTVFFSGLYWVCSARHHFKGPKRVDARVFQAINKEYDNLDAALKAKGVGELVHSKLDGGSPV